jgi:hypothetical protein
LEAEIVVQAPEGRHQEHRHEPQHHQRQARDDERIREQPPPPPGPFERLARFGEQPAEAHDGIAIGRHQRQPSGGIGVGGRQRGGHVAGFEGAGQAAPTCTRRSGHLRGERHDGRQQPGALGDRCRHGAVERISSHSAGTHEPPSQTSTGGRAATS